LTSKDRPKSDKVKKTEEENEQVFQEIPKNEYMFKVVRKTNEIVKCLCKPPTDDELACNSNSCINRGTKIECTDYMCSYGDKCANQRFQKKQYPKLEVRSAGDKGNGLFAKEDIREGQFIIEYIGEVISTEECMKRLDNHVDQNYYYFTVGEVVIDARKKGNNARYINHSCSPNATAEKWSVDGWTRVGIFATKDIKEGEEITFDYQYDNFGHKIKCHCGSPVCRGYLDIGDKVKADKVRYVFSKHIASDYVKKYLEGINIDKIEKEIERMDKLKIQNKTKHFKYPIFLKRNVRRVRISRTYDLNKFVIYQHNSVFESEQKKEEIKKKKRDANAIYSVDVESVFERDKKKDKKKSADNKKEKRASNGDEEKKASDSTKDMDIVKSEDKNDSDKMEIEENKEDDKKN